MDGWMDADSDGWMQMEGCGQGQIDADGWMQMGMDECEWMLMEGYGCLDGCKQGCGWMDADMDGWMQMWMDVDTDGHMWMQMDGCIHPSYDQEWSEMAGNKEVRNCWEWLFLSL